MFSGPRLISSKVIVPAKPQWIVGAVKRTGSPQRAQKLFLCQVLPLNLHEVAAGTGKDRVQPAFTFGQGDPDLSA